MILRLHLIAALPPMPINPVDLAWTIRNLLEAVALSFALASVVFLFVFLFKFMLDFSRSVRERHLSLYASDPPLDDGDLDTTEDDYPFDDVAYENYLADQPSPDPQPEDDLPIVEVLDDQYGQQCFRVTHRGYRIDIYRHAEQGGHS